MSSNPPAYQAGDTVTFTVSTTIPRMCVGLGNTLQLGLQKTDIPNQEPALVNFGGSGYGALVEEHTEAFAFPAAVTAGTPAIGSPVKIDFTPLVIPDFYASKPDSSGLTTHRDFYIVLWHQCNAFAEGVASVHVTYTCDKYDPSVLKQNCAYVTPRH